MTTTDVWTSTWHPDSFGGANVPDDPLFPMAQIKQHLNYALDQDIDDAELRRMLNAAIDVVAYEGSYLPGTAPTAAQRLAIYMVTADLWTTQRGADINRDDTGDFVIAPLLTRRVRELLRPTRIKRTSPTGNFPPAYPLPDPVRW